MSEQPISIANLNDFIFCPASIYFHSLDESTDDFLVKDSFQINGTAAHEKSDRGEYSTRKTMLQGISVYSSKFNIFGKIDTFDIKKGILVERKKKTSVIYDGYVFQLYAQFFALKEMGYCISELHLYSMDDNKVYRVNLPEEDKDMYNKFCNTISEMNEFKLELFKQQNVSKCKRCIYEPLCSFSALKENSHVNCT